MYGHVLKHHLATTSDVANHISGFRSEVIDKWERGEELPSITEAKKLANLYKVPFATFYLSNPPEKKTKAYTDRRTYNDTVYRETSYELESEIGRITGNRQIQVDISHILGNLITVIFNYQILRKPLKILSL